MKTLIALLLPIFLIGQITHMKPVSANIKGLGYRDLICLTFYRGDKLGFDLATYNGHLIGRYEVLNLKLATRRIDTLVANRIIREFNDRERLRKSTVRGQAIVIGISLLSAKVLADSKSLK